MNEKVLVIEDESDIRDLIHFCLFREKYETFLAEDGEVGLEMAKHQVPDLILLDLMLPKIDGLTICKEIRQNQRTKHIPIIMLTAKSSEDDIVKGLELGADDYITKPFSNKILMARVKSVLGRAYRPAKKLEPTLDKFGISIDVNRRKVCANEEELILTETEFQLLYTLIRKPGWVFTRSQLINEIHGEKHAITNRAIDVQVVGLRKKMGDFGNYIETVRGVGYRFTESEVMEH